MSLGDPLAHQFNYIESIYGIVSRSYNNQKIREAHFWTSPGRIKTIPN